MTNITFNTNINIYGEVNQNEIWIQTINITLKYCKKYHKSRYKQ